MNLCTLARSTAALALVLTALPAMAATQTTITEFSTGLTPNVNAPVGITTGPDGNLWFADEAGAIGQITPMGGITEFSVGLTLAGSSPRSITVGPDGNLWFADRTGAIGQVIPGASGAAPTITEFSTPIGSAPESITAGPDGNLWFADGDGAIGRVVPGANGAAPTIAEFSTGLNSQSEPLGITTGPDGNLWVGDALGAIGRAVLPTDMVSVQLAGTGAGTVTSTLAMGASATPSTPNAISCVSTNSGSTCAANFFDATNVTVTASAASGSTFTGWSGPGAANCTGSGPCVVTLAGADASVTADFTLIPAATLSVTTTGNGSVGSAPSGIQCGTVCMASFSIGTPVTLTAAPATGFIFAGWTGGGCSGVEACVVTINSATTVNATFTADSSSDITLVSALLPTSRSVQVGATATTFATLINTSTDTAGTLCQIQPATTIPAAFSFQATDPTTNALTGTANTPVTIAPGAAQSFVLGLTPTATFTPTQVAFNFTCANAPAASSTTGLNTLLLSASTTPTPDVIAISETATHDGIVAIPGANGVGAFALASVNVGAADTITASANVGGANLPVVLTICQTVPATGACMAAPAASVATMIANGATPTFSVFVRGQGNVPFQPAANRIIVQFTGSDGVVRGSSGVAVRTQ